MTKLFEDVGRSRRVLPGISSVQWVPILVQPSDGESEAHAAFMAALKEDAE